MDIEVAKTRYSNYDSRDFERPVRLEKTEGVVVIEGKAYPAREVIAALAQAGYSELRTVGDTLVLGSKRITPIFKSSKERAMASLCHGSLAYCCPLSKKCPERDRALEILGLRGEEYERLKMRAHYQFIDMAKGSPPLDNLWNYGETSARSVNRPAFDAGFGSDDYRRDFDRLERALQRRTSHERTNSLGWTSHSNGVTNEMENTRPHSQQSIHSTKQNRRAACSIGGQENVEGLSSLFVQGELSPFREDSKCEPGENRGFCFSCGRTIERNKSRCPYCGALQ